MLAELSQQNPYRIDQAPSKYMYMYSSQAVSPENVNKGGDVHIRANLRHLMYLRQVKSCFHPVCWGRDDRNKKIK